MRIHYDIVVTEMMNRMFIGTPVQTREWLQLHPHRFDFWVCIGAKMKLVKAEEYLEGVE